VYSREATRALEAKFQVGSITAEAEYKNPLDGFVSQARQNLAGIVSAFRSQAADQLVQVTAGIPALLQPVGGTIDAANNTIRNIQPMIEENFATLNGQTYIESSQKNTEASGILDRVALSLISLTQANTADASDTMRILTEDEAYQGTIISSMSQQVANFMTAENSRAQAKASSLDSISSTTTQSMAAILSSSVTTQIQRDNSQAQVNVNGMSALSITSQSGSTDYGTWCVDVNHYHRSSPVLCSVSSLFSHGHV
jgi:post-segregation antitoxin (ccd killing protein)